MQQIDPDAVLWRPADAGADLLVLLHGLGSHEGDLFGLVPHLPADLAVASLRAPVVYGGGFAWFDGTSFETSDPAMLDASAAAVLRWLDGLQAEHPRLHLLGFSQGGVVAVQMARQAPDRIASIAHLASFVDPHEHPGDAALAARQPHIPLLTTIGDLEDVIRPEAVQRSAPWLDAHFDVDRRTYHRAHSIVAEELADVVAFLERV